MQGSRLLASRLAAPLTDVGQINERLDAVQFFHEHHTVAEAIRRLLKRCSDVERCVQRISLGNLS